MVDTRSPRATGGRSVAAPNRVSAMRRASTIALYRAPWTAPELAGTPCFTRPFAACPIVPAKYTPGRVVLSHHDDTSGSRLRPLTEHPMSGRSRIGVVNPVAAMTSSTSIASSAAVSVRRTRTVRLPSPPSVRSMRSSAALRTATPPPSTKSSKGCTYRARTPASEFVWIENLACDGETSAMARAQGSSPLASSNPEFCLPRIRTRRPAYVSAGRTSA